MVRKEKCSAEFFEETGKIYLYLDSIHDEDHTIEGKVYFDHDQREIKIYNFSKKELTNEEKFQIIYSIFKATYLFPNYLASKELNFGNIATYTLKLNGYLLDGTFKERGKKYKSIIEEFIEDSDENEVNDDDKHLLKTNIKYFYNRYEEYLGKEEVKIFLARKGIINGIVSYMNFTRLFAAYLKSKGKRFRLITSNRFWDKERKMVILPY